MGLLEDHTILYFQDDLANECLGLRFHFIIAPNVLSFGLMNVVLPTSPIKFDLPYEAPTS